VTIHHFQPTQFPNVIGTLPPVLTVSDGDTIVTTTLDAAGRDAQVRALGRRPNPQTGPFAIEAAAPGDTLAVTFESIRPNRPTGYTRLVVAENVVEPGFVRTLPPDRQISWQIDISTGTTRPEIPIAGLESLRLALDPMLGCFGVAPANGQSIGTDTSGNYGGNMDYRRCRAGATVYLPVSAAGALFFLGDGHAVQGDGEVVGTGVETTFEVTFTMRLRRGWPITCPRGEDAGTIFAIGNARPLDYALQLATTEMMRWLMSDYGLDSSAASVLLGQVVRYEIGNVYDPAYTVACVLPKHVLAELRAG
jgi:amidase